MRPRGQRDRQRCPATNAPVGRNRPASPSAAGHTALDNWYGRSHWPALQAGRPFPDEPESTSLQSLASVSHRQMWSSCRTVVWLATQTAGRGRRASGTGKHTTEDPRSKGGDGGQVCSSPHTQEVRTAASTATRQGGNRPTGTQHGWVAWQVDRLPQSLDMVDPVTRHQRRYRARSLTKRPRSTLETSARERPDDPRTEPRVRGCDY